MEEKNNRSDGNIEVSESVLTTFVEKTVGEFKGLTLSRKKKSVKISRAEDGTTIDIGVDAAYGTNIPDVVRKVQREIKDRISEYAGVAVKEVNVTVEGLNIEEIVKK